MTASDSSPRPAPVDDATLASMREAVVGVWHDRPRGDPQLTDAMTRLCVEARTRGHPAEDVIVTLKTLLATIPELRDHQRRIEAGRLQDRLVTLCIRCYYDAPER